MNFPIMRGDARVARGASYFEVPLFTNVKDNLWQGCSPSEFPDEIEGLGLTEAYFVMKHLQGPTHCKWLYEAVVDDKEQIVGNKPRFDAILNLYQWGEYVVPEGVHQLTVEMYDSLEMVSEQVDDLAQQVVSWLDEGKKVLVHCQAGLNRSSLVVARVLMLKYNMKAWEAIKTIRDQRSQTCLCNETFVKHLLSLDQVGV